jgi:hypothetical protein
VAGARIGPNGSVIVVIGRNNIVVVVGHRSLGRRHSTAAGASGHCKQRQKQK